MSGKHDIHLPLYPGRCQGMAKRTIRNNGEKGVGKAGKGVGRGGDRAFNHTKAKFQEPLIVILDFWKTTHFYLSPWFFLGQTWLILICKGTPMLLCIFHILVEHKMNEPHCYEY